MTVNGDWEKGDFKIKCGDQWMDIVCDQTKVWNTPNKNYAPQINLFLYISI